MSATTTVQPLWKGVMADQVRVPSLYSLISMNGKKHVRKKVKKRKKRASLIVKKIVIALPELLTMYLIPRNILVVSQNRFTVLMLTLTHILTLTQTPPCL